MQQTKELGDPEPKRLRTASPRLLSGILSQNGYGHVWGFWVHVYKLLGAKYAVVGCIYMETFGCIYADVGCKSMERLLACLTVFACLTTVLCLPDSR